MLAKSLPKWSLPPNVQSAGFSDLQLEAMAAEAFLQAHHDLQLEAARLEAPTHWRDWLTTLFPLHVKFPFARRHEQLWNWVWDLRKGERPRPFVGIWPRGGAKSSSAELACVMIGTPPPEDDMARRRYVLYLSSTQAQADDHVQNIAGMLESQTLTSHYPSLSERRVGKYGTSKGWRRNRVRTASGLTIDAIGLDSAARGAKLDEDRPDFMVFDDLDGELDTLATTEKKIRVLTRKIIPAGAYDLAVLAIQNLIIEHGIFSKMADNKVDFLSDRIISGPFPAIENFTYEQREEGFFITGGKPTWQGQGIERCQEMIKDMGISAFLVECQNKVEAPPGGIFSHLKFLHCEYDKIPWGRIVRSTVWVDPAVTETDKSDSMGIQADALTSDDKIYRLWSWENVTNPEDALRRAILKALEIRADTVGVETDQGGDTWKSVYLRAWEQLVKDPLFPAITPRTKMPTFKSAKAGAGHGSKAHRASQMLVDYEHGKFIHVVGTHEMLEKALFRFPKTKPFDLVDAAFWSWMELRRPVRRPPRSQEY